MHRRISNLAFVCLVTLAIPAPAEPGQATPPGPHTPVSRERPAWGHATPTDGCSREEGGVNSFFCDPYDLCSGNVFLCQMNSRTGVLENVFLLFCPPCQPRFGLRPSSQRGTPPTEAVSAATDRRLFTPAESRVVASVATLDRESTSSLGTPAVGGGSLAPALSADGRLLAFDSAATNLIPGDTNQRRDVFVRDRGLGLTTRVSVSSGGVQGNGHSIAPVMTPDGRYVAFLSQASNLVVGDTNGVGDVFVHDRNTGLTERVNIKPNGEQATLESWPDPTGLGRYERPYGKGEELAISDDGRHVVFVVEAPIPT